MTTPTEKLDAKWDKLDRQADAAISERDVLRTVCADLVSALADAAGGVRRDLWQMKAASALAKARKVLDGAA